MKHRGFRGFLLRYSLIILASVVTVLLMTQYYFSYQMVLELATKRFEHLAKESTLLIQEKDRKSKEIVALLGHAPMVKDDAYFDNEMALLNFFTTPMRQNNKIFAIYIGYPNGNYFEVVNVAHSPAVRTMFNAPEGARWIVVKVIRQSPMQEKAKRISHFYDKELHYLSKLEEQTAYNPLKRPWYKEAMSHHGVTRGTPYRFYRLKKMGITYAMALEDQKSVIAMDLTLEGLNHFLYELAQSTQTAIYMLEDDQLIASSDADQSILDRPMKEAFASTKRSLDTYYKDGKAYLYMIIPVEHDSGALKLAFKAEKAKMMQPYLYLIYMEMGVTLLLMLLLIPLVGYLAKRFTQPIDALMKENEKVKALNFKAVTPIKSDIQELNQLSHSMVSMAQSIQAHEAKQEELLEAFIHLIADMIDAKSPYTGEHCKRVPLLTDMLLEEANQSTKEGLESFHIDDPEVRKGIEWSAWLHDCGKLVVPDYIIDKATKLETVYNRIHEIRTRFEVCLRDAKIEALEQILEGATREEAFREYAAEAQKLQEAFRLIAQMNMGDFKMTQEAQEQLHQIASKQWVRHFPKCEGLSWQEKERYRCSKEEELPVVEQLIYDDDALKTVRKESDYQLFKEAGVKMDIPSLLYNEGELYNLEIAYGTITKEEKFKIQEHVIHTLTILKGLPWNDKLKRIVEDAANHHEYLDGTGYPRALNATQLNIPAKIMVIADIFEALTSTDRPYKRSKTLSEALEIMTLMVEEGKLDGTLFALFIEKQIYLTYAKNHLNEAQIDLEAIDEEDLLKRVANAKRP